MTKMENRQEQSSQSCKSAFKSLNQISNSSLNFKKIGNPQTNNLKPTPSKSPKAKDANN
jgi:hypothetical protein